MFSMLAIALISYIMVETSVIANLVTKYQALFGQIVSDQYVAQSARAQTISSIFAEFKRYDAAWFGSGCLSSNWHGGFDSVYAANFYLADVGIIGTFYKFGVLSLFLLFLYFMLQFSALLAARGHPDFRFVLATCALVAIVMPVGAPLEYRGFITGLLLAVSIGCASEIGLKKSARPPLSSYDMMPSSHAKSVVRRT